MTTPPDTLILLSKVRVGVPFAVAFALNTTVHTPPTVEADLMVVLAGIPVPVTLTPAPIAILVVVNVTLGEPDVVVPTA